MTINANPEPHLPRPLSAPASRAMGRMAKRCALAAALWLPAASAAGDDRDLLRFQVARPYVFVLLDGSASMNLTMGPDDVPVEGGADNPDSRLYGAKEALFAVLSGVDDVQFGFAALNQDRLRVGSQHWLYYIDQVPGSWPFQGTSDVDWPLADPDGLTTDAITVDTNGDGVPDSGDGVPDNDIEGDALVFGATMVDELGTPLDGGTCAAPIDLGDETGRRQINAFAKTGASGNDETTVWLSIGSGPTSGTYRLIFDRPGTKPDGSTNVVLGKDTLAMKFRLSGPVTSCASPPAESTSTFILRLDPNLRRFVMVDRGPGTGSTGGGGGSAKEETAQLWPWSDAEDESSCGSSHPFAGKGWEGNYDSGVVPPDSPPGLEETDSYCVGDDCVNLKPAVETTLHATYRALDEGDLLPFRWEDAFDHRDEILQRLAPNWPEEFPRFGVAYHLSQTADAIGVFPPRVAGRRPLVAKGETPLEASINDFRCWYMGGKGTKADAKCGNSAFFEEDGWSAAACAEDAEYGCRRPFLLIISDGENTCSGEDATSDLSDMKSFSGAAAFALNVGDPKQCKSGGGLHSIVTPTGGECFNVATKEELKDALLALIGQIREQAQTFATAAVPSVQATSDQAIYISTFTPLNGKPVWDGHLNAFLKPLPITGEGSPDPARSCGDDVEAGCHLWDAGASVVAQYKASDPLGDGTDQRRARYSLFASDDTVPRTARLFDPVDCSDDTSPAFATCTDLLDGMQIPYDENDESKMQLAEDRANNAISAALTPRTHTLTGIDGAPGDTITYLLGDIFHSNPVVVGPPRNFLSFSQNLGDDGTACTDDESGNPGYRCFLRRQRFRRKVIFVGSDDGMLHAFDAGRFRESGTDPATGKTLQNRYGNGTGSEIFAFIPRAVLPTLLQFSEASSHHFTVDGSPAIADVFIDPAHGGTPDPGERRWRTLLVGSLREGGSAYFALDLTQPDQLEAAASGDGLVPDDGGASSYLPTCLTAYTSSACGPVPYGAALWELDDSHTDSRLVGVAPPADPPLPMDEDGNGEPDLGHTWSSPTLGRIRLCSVGGTECDPTPSTPGDDDDLIEMQVAVFGGGMDPDAPDKSQPERGDWLYMADVETGKVIYKRRLCSPYVSGSCATGGAAPSDPAAVDTDQDGYLDRIYIGTSGGYLYRADLSPMSDGDLPTLASAATTALDPSGDPVALTVERIQGVDASGEPVWEPRVIFDANWSNDGAGNVTATSDPRQLYHPPSVFFAARLGIFGLAFGTGNRENLWDRTEQNGRFYVLLDDTDALTSGDLPLDEGAFRPVLIDDPDLSEDLLFSRANGQKGWFLVLDPDERVITDAFALSGLTTFSAFQPETAVTDDGGGEVEITCGEKQSESDVDNLCARTGFSRNFVLNTTNGNGLLIDVSGQRTRFQGISTFVTTSFTEAGQLKSDSSDEPTAGTADELTQRDLDIMEILKSLFPTSCRFSNYRLDLKLVAADTRVERIAPVPICLQDKNFKEF